MRITVFKGCFASSLTAVTLTLFVGCATASGPAGLASQVGATLSITAATQAAVHQHRQQEVTFGVEWPTRVIQTIPLNANTVTFFVFQNGVQISQASVYRNPSIPEPTTNLELFPGNYAVHVRAYESLTPTEASPVLAQGAATFTVTQGQDMTVGVDLTSLASPSPGAPFPTISPSSSLSPSPMPTPSPSPVAQTGGTGLDLTIM